MTRTITARHVAACVETLILIGSAIACVPSNSPTTVAPPAGQGGAVVNSAAGAHDSDQRADKSALSQEASSRQITR